MTAQKRCAWMLAAALAVANGPLLPGASAQENGASPLSEDDCRAIWNVAAGRSDLGPDGAKPYIDSFESVDVNRDKKITNAEFKAGCKAGLVHKLRRTE